jgi:hypothetical protein
VKDLLTIIAGGFALGGYVPYAFDIVKGRAKPARAARIMFVFLLVITILQQLSVHSGTLIAFTSGELIGSVAILALAIKYGVGGFAKLDLFCYALLVVDVIVWLVTGNALIALHLSVLADLIAFTPTLVKTWRKPKSETPLFFMTGIIAPILNILATGRYTYAVLLFPIYLALANLVETLLIVIRGRRNPLFMADPTEPVV